MDKKGKILDESQDPKVKRKPGSFELSAYAIFPFEW